MKQRVAIARSLAYDPDVLLMDEPFAALDAQTRESLQDELLRIWRATGKTIVFITHGIDEAVYLGQRVAVMTSRPGRIKQVVDVDLGDRDAADGRSRSDPSSPRYRHRDLDACCATRSRAAAGRPRAPSVRRHRGGAAWSDIADTSPRRAVGPRPRRARAAADRAGPGRAGRLLGTGAVGAPGTVAHRRAGRASGRSRPGSAWSTRSSCRRCREVLAAWWELLRQRRALASTPRPA